ncbi:DUF4276 family protein [Algoriphagus sp. CAU 1675]|uniref:DUF4276 family protein n=1 Tax=Algoriphagus sp. CAU 1675 TaxID=3032597 RepID=UPI0023DBE8DB|nr:DUF4276 family protein [Algoriphagus sp. CAU 1675]MDF2156484.1 DUF4276 family protein [Algoriphagus sp. CAU 1675]
MKRLVFIVEGDTEIILVQNHIVPYLIGLGFTISMHAQTITTNRKQHKKGGVTDYAKFKNEVIRTFAQGNVIITTLIDFFRLPNDFPGYTSNSNLIHQVEASIHEDFGNNPDFIPYIQRHELEALMFSGREGFELVIDQGDQLAKIDQILNTYSNPEDINNDPETAPSKRLIKIFGYDKTGDGEMILEMLGIDQMLQKCPRFKEWIDKLIQKLSE